jgi:hypothetical protein
MILKSYNNLFPMLTSCGCHFPRSVRQEELSAAYEVIKDYRTSFVNFAVCQTALHVVMARVSHLVLVICVALASVSTVQVIR